ncbi:sodium/potassium-transporting ATPase subunit beta-3-like isoform X2 [Channa argus]|uniref:sodium/potassium-transporting ATPase subunit beta-3-like isoform X2 n=1 Tax=Channa argus TaxID=215402 RepID=UPI0035211D8E
MPSSPQDQSQQQNQEPKQELENQEQRDGGKEETKEEVKAEENENKNEEMKQKKKKEGKKEEMEQRKETWKDFIYNPATGEFLGRSASSWGLILLFYLVFYGFLAGMFSLTMWVMLQTLDENVPQHQDRVANPGLVIRPRAAEISFNRSDATKYNLYIQQLHELLQQYNDSIQEHNELCMVGEYTEQDNEMVKKVCQFKRSTLHQCSGLPDSSFGFAEGKPCIIVKMNRVIGLKPRGDPYINCTAKPDYVQPLVAVKLLLTKDDFNIEQVVECKLEGSNLRNDDERDKFQGRVTFRIKISE